VKAQQSGLWTRTAHGKRFIVRADKMLTAFLERQKGDTRVRGEFGLVMAAQYKS